ncbi:helix-turn-helix domain-containing protein [Paractinoplanes toevensis]|uniref:AraC-family regulatory protein n=1 Tax=Paractinoplanes toevensis TaxID=571911 RepID=A0A919THU7_9ACTN|nr:AraC family transcriptional regulator [Actinoplanes toevensis]GIM95221.1 putative AraC-family regulatory protein [Actinoplanes toevensis]
MIHSVPVRPEAAGCETAECNPARRLRGHVIGYGGFRSLTGRAIPHRLLPISLAALIVDFAEEKALVTGPRAETTTNGPTTWGHGITVGLTPAGAAGLLGVPMRELTGRTVRLDELPGRWATDLPERLAAAATWPGRFDLLNRLLATRLGLPTAGGVCGLRGPEWAESDLAMAAWRRLQRAGGRLRIGDLAAELGVARRGLEREVRDAFGLPPGAVGRITRFQRAVQLLAEGLALAEVAIESGYADQPHLTRETRVMAGVTPGELRAFVQHRPMAPTAVP